MNRLLAIFARGHQPDPTALSAYLDGELAPARVAGLEAHLDACDACSAQLTGLRELRSMLRAMPEVEAPRSFRLRQADVERAPKAAVAPPPSLLMRAMPVVSAGAVLVFVVAVGADLRGGASRDFSANGSAERMPAGAIAADDGSEDFAGEAPQPTDAPPPGVELPAAADSADGATPQGPLAAERSNDGETGVAPDAPGEAGANVDGGAAATEQAQERLTATSVRDGADDGNNAAIRSVQIAAGVIALAAGGLALRSWMRRREGAL